MDTDICEGSSMVSCVVRGLSRSMAGGASLSYRHTLRCLVLNVLRLLKELFLEDVWTSSVDVEATAFLRLNFLS